MKLKQDTHMHTTYSDGAWTPKQVVKEAAKRKLERIAITDHEAIAGIEEARQEGKKHNISVWNGIELFTEEKYGELLLKDSEILAYGFDITKMEKVAKHAKNQRVKKMYTYIDQLNQAYDDQRIKKVNKEITKIAKGDPFILALRLKEKRDKKATMKGLLESKLAKKIKSKDVKKLESNSTFISYDMIQYMKDEYLADLELLEMLRNTKKYNKKLGFLIKDLFQNVLFDMTKMPTERTQKETIKTILDCGGIPVLAHPGAKNENIIQRKWLGEPENGKLCPEEWIETLVSYGLKGIELYYYAGNTYSEEYNIKANDFFYKLAKKHNLILTYGTDCHGPKVISYKVNYRVRKPSLGGIVESDPLNKVILNLDFTKL